jgi:hypothetical protein
VLGKLNIQLSTIRPQVAKNLPPFLGRFNIEELRVCKTADLSRATVHGDTHIINVLDILENILQITVRKLIRDTTNEKSIRWGMVFPVIGLPNLAARILQDDLTAFQDLIVQILNGVPGPINRGEFAVAESRFVAC